MNYADIRSSIVARFVEMWDNATGIKVDNQVFKPIIGESYIEISVLMGKSFQVTLGTTQLHRSPGVISINICTPLNTGTNNALVYADTVDEIFRSQQFGTIKCRVPYLTTIGRFNKNWWCTNITVPFYSDISIEL